MSDLRYQTVEQLKVSKASCESHIQKLKGDLHNANIRLEWINKYLFEKTPQELTMSQIEHRLGHRIIVKTEA